MPEWTAEVIAQLHKYGIKRYELAEAAGFTPAYVSLMLHGRKTSERARVQICNTLLKLIMQKQAG